MLQSFFILFKFREPCVGNIRSEAIILGEFYSQENVDDVAEEILHLKEYMALEDKKNM